MVKFLGFIQREVHADQQNAQACINNEVWWGVLILKGNFYPLLRT
jgi:hypothetical protein